MDSARDLFLKYDYVEAKDLCKQFLTVNIGVVVFSLTFAEKVVGFNAGSRLSKLLLVSSWCCLLASIIICGTSLAYMSLGAGRVVYGERCDFQNISERTLVGVAFAGGMFVLGLLLLAGAAARTVLA
jgi:hypothetical protein